MLTAFCGDNVGTDKAGAGMGKRMGTNAAGIRRGQGEAMRGRGEDGDTCLGAECGWV